MTASAVDAAAAWMSVMVPMAYRRILYRKCRIETGDRQTLFRLDGVNMTFAFAVQREPPTHQGHGWLDSFPSDSTLTRLKGDGILAKLISLHAETT